MQGDVHLNICLIDKLHDSTSNIILLIVQIHYTVNIILIKNFNFL